MDRDVHGSPGVPRGPQGGVLSTRSAGSWIHKRDQRGCGQRVRHHEYSYTAATHHGAAGAANNSAGATNDGASDSANHAAYSERAADDGTARSADHSPGAAHGAAEHASGNSTGQHPAEHPSGESAADCAHR